MDRRRTSLVLLLATLAVSQLDATGLRQKDQFYGEPEAVQGEELVSSGGGRVTELTARPLINLFYPELSGMGTTGSGGVHHRIERGRPVTSSVRYCDPGTDVKPRHTGCPVNG